MQIRKSKGNGKMAVDPDHVEAAWAQFSRELISVRATPKEVEACRTSFYCGAMFMYDFVYCLTQEDNATTIEQLQAINSELIEFAQTKLMDRPEGTA